MSSTSFARMVDTGSLPMNGKTSFSSQLVTLACVTAARAFAVFGDPVPRHDLEAVRLGVGFGLLFLAFGYAGVNAVRERLASLVTTLAGLGPAQHERPSAHLRNDFRLGAELLLLQTIVQANRFEAQSVRGQAPGTEQRRARVRV
ncbi:hypothetical protein [Variovorax sp. LARHSF232]